MTIASPLAAVGYPDPPDPQNPLALALNENPFSPLPAVQAAMVAVAETANRYPEFLPQRLRHLIAGHMGVAGEQVVIGAGATGVVMQVLNALTSPGERMAFAYPTFDGYPIFAQIARLTSVPVPLDAHGHHDLDAMADAAAGSRVVVLCRPHNPTGTIESETAVRALLNRIARDTVVVLDEAYVEFVAPDQRIDAATLVRDHPNVVVVRTFSKAYGLAGIRTGYGFCAPEIAAAVWSMQLPFGSTSTSLAAVDASFRAESQLRQRIVAITAERAYLRSQLRSRGIWTTESHANFLYLSPGAAPWQEVFADTGVQVRCYGDGGVRVTVGTRQSTHAVLAALSTSGMS